MSTNETQPTPAAQALMDSTHAQRRLAHVLAVVEDARDVERAEFFTERARAEAAWHAACNTPVGTLATAHWLGARDQRADDSDRVEVADLLAEVERRRSGLCPQDMGVGVLTAPPQDYEPDTSLLCGVRLLPEECRRPFRLDAFSVELAVDALRFPGADIDAVVGGAGEQTWSEALRRTVDQ